MYASGTLLRETITATDAEGNTTTETLDFVYDLNGSPYALNYTNGTAATQTYYYITNVQGDVTHLVTTDGTVVAEYGYDAWGKVTAATGSMAEVNPLRYRGYHYDADSGFYYLQSRYFDSTICRFISADSYTSTEQGFLGRNMFAYCNNSPINACDLAGTFGFFTLANAVFGAVVGAVTQVATNIATGNSVFEGVVGAAVGGAVYNVVAITTGSIVAASAAGSAAEALTNEVGSYLTGEKKLTAQNVMGSLANVAHKTAEGTIVAATTGTLASKIVKTNRGWFKPKKFISSFTGKYARKVLAQTAVQGAMTLVYNISKHYAQKTMDNYFA